MTEPSINDILPIVDRVAKEVARWSGLEAEEIAGHLGEVVARRAVDYLVTYLEHGPGMVELNLQNEAGRLASRERVRRQREQGQYYYDPEYVRLFLPYVFVRNTWPYGPAPDGTVGPGQDWATTEALDTAIDMSLAFPKLRPWQQRVIMARHQGARLVGGRPDWGSIAERCGYATAEAAEKSYYRATAELAVAMNSCRAERAAEHEGPGSRSAMSSARAQYIVGNQDAEGKSSSWPD